MSLLFCYKRLHRAAKSAICCPMTEQHNSDDTPRAATNSDNAGAVDHGRRTLALGVLGTSAIVSVRPAFAQTAVSVLNCEIPVPGPTQLGLNIAADGSVVPADTPGSFPSAPVPFKGEDVRKALAGGQLPGTTPEQSEAYLQYIRRLRAGQTGFTCFASIQMPR